MQPGQNPSVLDRLRQTFLAQELEGLSEGQAGQLSRVVDDYPHLTDDAFVAQHRERWLA